MIKNIKYLLLLLPLLSMSFVFDSQAVRTRKGTVTIPNYGKKAKKTTKVSSAPIAPSVSEDVQINTEESAPVVSSSEDEMAIEKTTSREEMDTEKTTTVETDKIKTPKNTQKNIIETQKSVLREIASKCGTGCARMVKATPGFLRSAASKVISLVNKHKVKTAVAMSAAILITADQKGLILPYFI